MLNVMDVRVLDKEKSRQLADELGWVWLSPTSAASRQVVSVKANGEVWIAPDITLDEAKNALRVILL